MILKSESQGWKDSPHSPETLLPLGPPPSSEEEIFRIILRVEAFPVPARQPRAGGPSSRSPFPFCLFFFLFRSFFLSFYVFFLSVSVGSYFFFRLAWVPIQFYFSLGFTSLWPFGLVKEIQDFFHESAMSGVDLSIITGISVLNRPLRAETPPLILHLIAICRGEFFIQQPTHSLSLKRTFSLLSKNLSMFVIVP